MKDLISKIEELRNSDAQKIVKKRMSGFEEMKERGVMSGFLSSRFVF